MRRSTCARCKYLTLPLSAWCYVHRPWTPEGLVSPWDLSDPTRTEAYGDGKIRLLAWETDGVPSRTDGPAAVTFDPFGAIVAIEWCLDGARHRDDGPAVVRLTPARPGWVENYFRHGRLHRIGGPAVNYFYPNGSPMLSIYAERGFGRHRLDGPTDTSWHADGSVKSEEWFVRDERFPGAAEVEVYADAFGDGAPHEWDRAFALGSVTDGLGWRAAA